MQKTILITGMSGIKIEACLKKFISNFKDFRTNHIDRKPCVIKFDSVFEDLYYKQNASASRSKQAWKNVILKQSYPILQQLWSSTLKEICIMVSDIRKEDPDKVILINLHSCYYHNMTQEYLSFISIKELLNLNPSFIVTFIDDIYEIYHRLTLAGGIFHDESNVTPTQMILRLLRLLDWRAKETMLSRFIANNLGITNYVFAVKHSFDTFSNLLFENCPKVYLSHPITEIRRLEANGNAKEATKVREEIADISDRLSSNFTTFLPTTIDEFIIKEKPTMSGKTKIYYPALEKRWNVDQYKTRNESLYTNSGFTYINKLWKENASVKIDKKISNLLEALSASISDQVTIRDYTLVEQSDMLVVYRPVFNGNASGGVKQEFNYEVV